MEYGRREAVPASGAIRQYTMRLLSLVGVSVLLLLLVCVWPSEQLLWRSSGSADADGDGIPDDKDPDDDNDGIPDHLEESLLGVDLTVDTDGDGIPDYLDPDDDNDGIPDVRDADKNGDGIPDIEQDIDGDGIPDYLDADDDGDGIPDSREGSVYDTDGDGLPDDVDDDDDNDGIPGMYLPFSESIVTRDLSSFTSSKQSSKTHNVTLKKSSTV